MILTAANDLLQITVPPEAYTLGGFRHWVTSDAFPEMGRVTYYQREIFLDMSPEKANSHNAVKSEICRVLGNLVLERDLGKLYQDGMWLTNDVADVSNEADGTFVAWDSFQQQRVQLVTYDNSGDGIELRGSPDWVLEVVSNSSVVKDTQRLREAYHRAGVREYWLVDARSTDLQFQVLTFRPHGFVEVPASTDGWFHSDVFQAEFQLLRSRDRIGGWSFSLSYR
ncbi:MAG: Uma2 family endonuclease [Pirellulaceae bacterium]|nr:Uma2 family endonuclease [Planctomycetales bacterium]